MYTVLNATTAALRLHATSVRLVSEHSSETGSGIQKHVLIITRQLRGAFGIVR